MDHDVFVRELYFNKQEYGKVNHQYQMDLNSDLGKRCFNESVEFLEDKQGI
ncbi:MAG: hypothetical protein Q4E50_03315 [Tissierellia bacterium]|nr:hypothetical protein [Tissierellia bacterium]